MSTRPHVGPELVINAQSMATSLESAPTIIQKISMPSYEVVWSAGSTPVGTVSVQVSNDYSLYPNGNVHNTGTWTTLWLQVGITTTQTIAISGNSGNGFIDVPITGAYAIRLIYTRTSGGGTMNVYFSAKVS